MSLTNKREILPELMKPRSRTRCSWPAVAALIAVPLSVGLGIIAAINEGKWQDRWSNIVSLATISVPEFFIAYMLILVFAVKLRWFPSLSTVFDGMPAGEMLYKIALPAVTLTMLVAAHMLRMTRSSVLSVMSQPYIEMAFLKGMPRSRVIMRHALPNAAAPIISVIALNLAYLIVGVVVIEVVFVYPGVGQYMVDGVTKRDLPVVQACGLMFAATFIILNTVADILAILVNPRLRKPTRWGLSHDAYSDHKPNATAWVGLIIVGFFVFLVAIFAPWIAPYSQAETVWRAPGRRSSPRSGWAPTRSAGTCCRASSMARA